MPNARSIHPLEEFRRENIDVPDHQYVATLHPAFGLNGEWIGGSEELTNALYAIYEYGTISTAARGYASAFGHQTHIETDRVRILTIRRPATPAWPLKASRASTESKVPTIHRMDIVGPPHPVAGPRCDDARSCRSWLCIRPTRWQGRHRHGGWQHIAGNPVTDSRHASLGGHGLEAGLGPSGLIVHFLNGSTTTFRKKD